MLRFRIALLLLLLVILAGVAGFMFIERWSFFDALYMSIITLATVGFSEVQPLSNPGRAFTIGLILAGRCAEVYAVVVFTQVLVVEHLRLELGRRRMQKDVAQMHDHYLICGWGRMGQEIVELFRLRHAPFLVLEINEEKVRRLTEMGVHVMHGDAADDQTLIRAGVKRARGLIAVAPRDADNIFIALSARALNKDLFIVARCAHEQDVQKFYTAGANRVISPYVIGARRIAAAAFHPAVVDFLEPEVHRDDLEWELEDIHVTEKAVFVGKSLRDSGIREQAGCTILALREGEARFFHSNPGPDTVLRVGDTLIALGLPHQLAALEELAGMAERDRTPRGSGRHP
jgi:voltage-gated potassium channel